MIHSVVASTYWITYEVLGIFQVRVFVFVGSWTQGVVKLPSTQYIVQHQNCPVVLPSTFCIAGVYYRH